MPASGGSLAVSPQAASSSAAAARGEQRAPRDAGSGSWAGFLQWAGSCPPRRSRRGAVGCGRFRAWAHPGRGRAATIAAMTDDLFRADAYLRECEARVLRIDEAGIVLDRTVFYPLGGGQAGDSGVLAAGRRPRARHRRHAQGQGRRRQADRRDRPRAGAGPGRPARRAAGRATRVTAAHRLGAPPQADALPHRHPPAVPPGAAAGQRLLDHARLRAARLPHDRPARQGSADGRPRAAGRRRPIRWWWAPSPTPSSTPTRPWSRA